jgi:ligand-binding SRPBCC domain-containing protein
MHLYKLERQALIPRPIEEVFAFFSDPYNLEKITPPWLSFRIMGAPREVYRGCIIHYRLRIRGLPITWVSHIVEWDPPKRFIDVQLIGPYKVFHHVHEFSSTEAGTLMRDEVTYALPLGWFGRLAHRLFVRRDLETIFDYRQQRMAEFFPTR